MCASPRKGRRNAGGGTGMRNIRKILFRMLWIKFSVLAVGGWKG